VFVLSWFHKRRKWCFPSKINSLEFEFIIKLYSEMFDSRGFSVPFLSKNLSPYDDYEN
jgi:hypothetical protein